MSNTPRTLRLSPRILRPEIDVAVGERLLDTEFLPKICRKTKWRIAVVADKAVAIVGEKLKKTLSAELFLFEGEKTRKTKERLEDALLKKGFGRDTLIVAIGGGTTTDLVSFLASTYMRGVPLLLVPTTLLAMVDAGIGGKTGVDTPFGKNLIGSFYFPAAIAIDTALLETLPEREWKNGLAEILKYGLIKERAIWELSEKHSSDWQKPEILEELILLSIRAKMKIVEEDPEEKGLRRILNFGHTVGHALEHLSRYRIPHGLAVAIGCQAESFLSHRLGYLSEEALEKILKVYERCGFPRTAPQPFPKDAFLGAMRLDKKGKEGHPRFVQIDQIGNCPPFDGEYCRKISPSDCDALAEWMELRDG